MMQTFDLLGPLPEGTTVLEASAGTGKTHTVGALAARYVAEGVCGLDQMLIVTFGRAATRELRERVRDQLVEVDVALADPAVARAAGGVVAHLAAADDHTVAERRRRVSDALASFDSATIATTHQFCQTVLRSLGVAGDTDADVTLVEDLDDLVVEVVDDVYLAQYGSLGAAPLTHADALALARQVVGDPHTELTPGRPEIGSASDHRMFFAREVRREMDRRKRDRGVVSFDDLLSHLADALDAPGSPARERMLARWSVVLVDEFQDTDPVQWQVLQRAFDGDATLVLIGDPKQAIYAFRGGDIEAYLAAVEAATDRRTLGNNYRSDGPLVDALQVLTQGAQLGHRAITVQPISAHRPHSRLAAAPVAAPIRVRVVDLAGQDDARLPPIGALREHIAVDLADDVARLLASDATFDDGQGPRPIAAGDVAVLMRSLWDAEPIRVALAERGIASVVADRRSVLLSPAADEWLRLLEALERQAPDRVRSVGLTSFFGRSPAELDAGGDALTDDLAEQVRDLLDLFRARGVSAVREAVFGRGLAARVLSRPGGERILTDLEHVGELLHDVTLRRRLSLPALLTWLRDERRQAGRPHAVDARQRRLDTDAAAVQIVTIHSSKGLQYPIVYLPHSFNRRVKDVRDEVALLHHENGERMLEIGRPLESAAISRSRAEDAGEDLRLTYVALTRAQSQVVAWWGPSKDSAHGGLSRLLLGRGVDQPEVPATLEQVPTVADATSRFSAWQEAGGLVVEPAVHQRHDVAPAQPSRSPLTVRVLDRALDTVWRRTSYTGLLRAAEGASTTTVSEPEVAGTVDEIEVEDDTQVDAITVQAASAELVSPMADLPAGAGFGSLVHAVLEVADPHATDLEAELRAAAAEQLRWWPVPATADDIAHGLVPLHDTPLGPVAADLTLRDIGLDDRLCELDFEFPLAGGEDADPAAVQVVLAQMADVLRRHLAPDDLLTPYADQLGAGPLGAQELRGYLSGSIDVVLRIPHGPGHRFVVVDYKTNRLGSPDRPLTAADYTPQHMAASMMHSHYPLQAMLYAVVLHRYLRWRLPDYDPAVHLGGVQYHYVRGMCGPRTPVVDGMTCGVFAWQPPAALVVELSDLLAGSPTQEVHA